MTNILLIYSEEGPTTIETKKCFYELKQKGYFELKTVKTIHISRLLLEWCDVLLGIRSTESIDKHLFQYARKKGIYVIEVLDDDFLSLGSVYGSEGQGFWRGRKKALIQAVNNIDCLLAPNKHIIEKYKRIGNIEDTYVSNTPMDIDGFVTPMLNKGKVKIVYYVNDGTIEMFEKYVRPALQFISENLKDRISFYFLALRPDMSEYDGRLEYHYIPHMSYDEFMEYLRRERFDIGLAPLDDSEFSKSKYINKFIEYTRAGVAGIYSNCELYRTVIEDEYNGILCAGEDHWGKAIQNLADNPQKRLEIAINAQNYAKDHLEKSKVLNRLIDGIPALVNHKAPAHVVSNVYLLMIKLYYVLIFRPCGWGNTLYCCIKNGKADMIVNRFRRKILKRDIVKETN